MNPNDTAASPARAGRCPSCGATVERVAQSRWRPFCSERCKFLDFGAWLAESYRVPAVEREDDGAPPQDPAAR